MAIVVANGVGEEMDVEIKVGVFVRPLAHGIGDPNVGLGGSLLVSLPRLQLVRMTKASPMIPIVLYQLLRITRYSPNQPPENCWVL